MSADIDEADIDEIAVERALEGDTTVPLTADEQNAVWQRLEADDCSAEEIAQVLGISSKTVVRWRTGFSTPIGRKGRPGALPPKLSDVLATPVPATPEAPTPTPTPAPAPAPAPSLSLVAQALRHDSKQIRTAGQRAKEQLNKLQALIDADAGKAAARAEVARLEAQLAEAKRRLKGSVPPTPAASTPEVSGADVWAWAKKHGYHVKPGRPPKELIERYREAQS